MKCFWAVGMSTSIGFGFIEAQPNSRRTTPSDAYRNTTMTASCRAKGERQDKSDADFCQEERDVPEKTSGADRSAPLRRLSRRESRLLGLRFERTVAHGAVVEVQHLLVVDGLTVLERDLTGRILRLRRRHLGLDARGLPGDLRAARRGSARAEVGALGAIRAAAPGPDRRLGEGHHGDDQRHRRQCYDSHPPHVTLRGLRFTAFDSVVVDPEIATRVPGVAMPASAGPVRT